MAQSEAQSTVEKWVDKSQKYSINSDALVGLCRKALETTAIVLSQTSDKPRKDLAITSLDNERKLIFPFEKNGLDALRHLSFGLIETIQVLLEDKGKNIEEHNRLVNESVSAAEFVQLQQKLLESDGKLKRAVEMAGEYKARVEVLEKLIDTKENILENANSAESLDELRNKVAELTKQLEEREGRMRDQERFKQDQSIIMRQPPPSETGTQLAIVDGDMGESLVKKEEMDFDFEVNNAILPIEQPLYEVPSNDEDSRVNIVHSDVMGEDVNYMDDPIVEDRNSIPIEMNTFENLSSNGGNVDESDQAEMIGEANVLMGEEGEEDKRVDHTTINQKDSSETGEVEKKKPKRTSTKPVKYTESFDESEPPVKKPNINSEKKIDNKRKSERDESPSNSSTKGLRVSKINATELECPNCEYRSHTVYGWYLHIKNKHSTTPHRLNLALVCECGDESYSYEHSRKCEISKITIVRKNSTPKCAMCEVYPRTACGYAVHLKKHHNTSLMQMGMFLTCSCGYKLTSHNADPEHTKKCNGLEFTLHNVDDEE